MSEDNSGHMHYFALVALVAVVAVISLVLSMRAPSLSEDLTGNVFRWFIPTPTPPSLPAEEEADEETPIVIVEGEETTEEIVVVAEELSQCNPVFINQAELERRFGTGNVDYSAAQWCLVLEYDNCIAVQMEERIRYFDSTNGSCQNTGSTATMKPLTPIDNVDNYLVNCGRRAGDDIRGIPQANSCYDIVGNAQQDTMISRRMNGVLCCS